MDTSCLNTGPSGLVVIGLLVLTAAVTAVLIHAWRKRNEASYQEATKDIKAAGDRFGK